jgi:hypothetical protein
MTRRSVITFSGCSPRMMTGADGHVYLGGNPGLTCPELRILIIAASRPLCPACLPRRRVPRHAAVPSL